MNSLFTFNKLILIGAVILIIGGALGIRYYLMTKDASASTSPDNYGASPVPAQTPDSTPSSDPTASPTNVEGASTQNTNIASTPEPSSAPTAIPTTTPTPSPIPTPCTSSSTADSGHSTFSANPSSLNADGSSSTTITVTIEDSCGDIIPGAVVNLLTSDTGAAFWATNQGSNITNSQGQAQFNMTSTNSGTDQINVLSQINGTDTTLNNLGSVTFNSVSSTPTPSPSPTPS